MLRARLFGDLAVWVDEQSVPPIAGVRPRSLFAYLLLHPGMHPRTRLAGRFWPDVLETSARASLRSALWTIRAALEQAGGSAYLSADRMSVGIAPDLPRDVDAARFERLVASGDAPSLAQAVALSDAPLLADLADEWALDAQDAHRERLIDVLERLADAREQTRDVHDAIRLTRAALAQDRLREASHRALMRRLALAGEPAQALGVYRRLRTMLAAELGVAPSRETRELAESLRDRPPQVPSSAPRAPATPDPGRSVRGRPRPALLGRQRELAVLANAWDRARSGHGGVAYISGPAGIGKTRLVDELSAHVRADGGCAAAGGCVELAGAPPFSPWLEALRDLLDLASAPPSGAWPRDLARLLPAVESRWGFPAEQAATTPDLERVRVFEAVVELIGWVARSQPLLLVLGDLHRADPSSTALLSHVGRRLGAVAALLVVTRRPSPEHVDLDLAIDSIRRRDGLVADLTLEGLLPADVHAMVTAISPGLDPELAARIADAADGNPLLAGAAARAAAQGHDPADGLRATTRAQLAALGETARLVVNVAAAAGRPIELWEIADTIGSDGLLEAVQEAVDEGVLELRDRQVRFGHQLVRDACYAALPAARRADVHRRLGDALSRRSDRSPAEIARHLRLGGQDVAAQRYLAAAARKARDVGALDEATAYLREAFDIGAGDIAVDADLWLALADLSAWKGDRAGMDQAFVRAAALYADAGDDVGLATAHAFRARWLHTTLCYPGETLQAAREALGRIGALPHPTPEARLLALASAAWAEAVAGDPAAVDPLIAEARSTLEGMGDRALEAELEEVRGTALVRSGAFAEGAEVCARAADLALIAGRHELAALSTLTGACALACLGDFERVVEQTDLAAARPSPGDSLDRQIRAARAYASMRLGRADEAIRAARENAELAASRGSRRDEALAGFDLGTLLLETGLAAEAAPRLAAALEEDGAPIPRALTRLRLAEALARSGDGEGADVEIARFPFEPVRPADLPQTLVARLAHVQGLVAASRGEEVLAARRFHESERVWRRIGGSPSGEMYAAVLVDLGRPPVAGLVEPGRELERLAIDSAGLTGAAAARGG